MQATVFCKTTAKATQSFFVKVGGREYFLFQQDFRKSNKEFFRNGVGVHAINNYSSVHSTAVKKTLDKLPSYIRYIEKEYDVAIYEKTKKKLYGKVSMGVVRTTFLIAEQGNVQAVMPKVKPDTNADEILALLEE